ncbi:MAG: hypothetical protein WCF84_23090 [Anaerolineae bacterium]
MYSTDLLLDDAPLLVMPALATRIGLNAALALQQLDHWLRTRPHVIDGTPWVYHSLAAWRANNFPFWSVATIARTFHRLVELGLVRTGNFNRTRYDRTTWYTIDYDRVQALDAPAPAPDEKSIPATGTDGIVQDEKSICATGTDGTVQDEKSIYPTCTNGFVQNEESIYSTCTNPFVQNGTTIPEITTEITTENTTEKETVLPAGTGETERGWEPALRELKGELPRVTYDAYLRDGVVLAQEAGRLQIALRRPQALDWINYRLRPLIQRAVNAYAGGPVALAFVVQPRGASP